MPKLDSAALCPTVATAAVCFQDTRAVKCLIHDFFQDVKAEENLRNETEGYLLNEF